MINDQLLAYVKQQLALNVGRDVITTNLKSQGWSDSDIDAVFVAIPANNSMPTSNPGAPVASPITPNVGDMPTVQTDFPDQAPSRSKKLFLVIGILILLLALGGGAYAYYSGAFVSLQSVMKDVIGHAQTSKTVSYDATLNFDFSGIKSFANGVSSIPGLNSKQLSVTVTGSSDITDTNNIKNSSVISVNLGSLSLGAEIRLVDDTLYAELTKVSASMSTLLGVVPITSFENKWYSFSYKPFDKAKDLVSGLPSADQNMLGNLTTDQKDHLSQIAKDASLIKQTAKLSDEVITGESSYHFAFDLDRPGIVAYLKSITEYINSIGKDNSVLSAFDATSFSKQLDSLKDFKGEIWIGKNDKLMHKIVISFGIQPDPVKDEQVKTNMVFIFSGYNQPVSIVAPAESVPFETLISSMMSGSSTSTPPKVKVK